MPVGKWMILLSFALNTGFAIYGIMADKKAFSLNQVFWIFNGIFLGIVPLFQYTQGVFPWKRNFSNTQLLQCNILILLCMLVYSLVRYRMLSSAKGNRNVKTEEHYLFRPHGRWWLILIHTGVVLGIIWLKNGDIFSREMSRINNSSLLLLIDKGMKGLLLCSSLLGIQAWKDKQVPLRFLLWLLGSGLLVSLPVAEARYWIACYYGSIFLVFLKEWLQQRIQLFRLGILSGLLLIFPLLSILRYDLNTVQKQFGSIKSVYLFSFRGGDFDAYSSVCNTIQYIQTTGITWGKQLLSVLLFFVPRDYWPGKGIGSGALVNQLPGSDFRNFSSPLIAEGLINFGITGALLFMSLLSWATFRLDWLYWQNQRYRFSQLFYPALTGLLFFILRGDLLSSFAYTSGIGLCAYACFRVLMVKHNQEEALPFSRGV